MGINNKKIVATFFISIIIVVFSATSYGHSGGTDQSGGHKDNKNKSGLGGYHYHCGGNPAHLHTNGICKYSSTATKTTTESTSSSLSSSNEGSKKTVEATKVEINDTEQKVEVGSSKFLTTTIEPANTTDKTITWKSSNETIATVSSNGAVIGKKAGIAIITATSINGRSDSITIEVKDKEKNNQIINSTVANNNEKTTSNEARDNVIANVATLGILGGGCYWGYKKYNKLKENNK